LAQHPNFNDLEFGTAAASTAERKSIVTPATKDDIMKTTNSKLQTKKLTLGKETVKALTDEQLRGIAAGEELYTFFQC